MDFSLTDEQELLIESIQEFCERNLDEDKISAMFENHGMSDELIKAYLEAGFGLMGIPEELGGVPLRPGDVRYPHRGVRPLRRHHHAHFSTTRWPCAT